MLPFKRSGPLAPIQPNQWNQGLRWAGLLSIGVLLFLLGQFDEQAFAGLTQLWRSILGAIPRAQPERLLQLGTQGNLSRHGLLVALSYRLLYMFLSVGLLWLASRGRHLRTISLSYAGSFLTGCLVLVAGCSLHQPMLIMVAHQLIDLICSPLAILLAYPLMLLAERENIAHCMAHPDNEEKYAV